MSGFLIMFFIKKYSKCILQAQPRVLGSRGRLVAWTLSKIAPCGWKPPGRFVFKQFFIFP